MRNPNPNPLTVSASEVTIWTNPTSDGIEPASQPWPELGLVSPLVSQVLDPYPERSIADQGVRPTADYDIDDLELCDLDWTAQDLSVVAASVEPRRLGMRLGWFPLATVILSVFAQAVLASVIANRTVPAVVGVVAAVSILLCSLALIFARYFYEASKAQIR